MSIKSAPYYWVTCDGEECGRSAQEGDFSAYGDADNAIEEAVNAGWLEVGNKHYCYGCSATLNFKVIPNA